MKIQISGEVIRQTIESAKIGGDYAAENQINTNSSEKADGSIVTESDVKAEELIRNRLSDSPHPVVGEEGESSPNSNSYWVVDPIDGTANYWRQQPLYNTSVALINEGEIVSGCVYSPQTDEVFYAQKGKGAYINEYQLPQFNGEINNSFAAIDGLISEPNIERFVRASDFGFQKLNSAALSLAYVASRRVDTAVIGNVNIWDIAAGIILSREAGATVRSYSAECSQLKDIKDGNIIVSWSDSAAEKIDAHLE